ncbi:GNAT family N-acetyltransferase [Massilia sp. DJPM01]|uniref:GNAT family N-acetyltransferase n=1 Tax=Massilia sp. DJPM01 TaxID=3024404 RepID=UPI00259F6984|nr:GNAT family N-acetyltransferase [Massilia sp. DJPM01]MDM5178935.1 GNAT family N-acetyltransferase [Massilia sp. DJPM01]
MPDIHIRPLVATPALIDTLARLLAEVVAQGGSVGFMHPLAGSAARTFWERALQAAVDGQRIVFGAFEDDQLVATVSLLLDCPPNQPHRAEIAKMMTLPRCRGRGIAAALLQAAEAAAVARGKTLLVLDTASDGGAAGLYGKHGFTLAGEIPDYALKPHGGLTGTLLYWKRIGVQELRVG